MLAQTQFAGNTNKNDIFFFLREKKTMEDAKKAIWNAARKGDVEALEAAIDLHPECIDVVHHENMQTPLHIAAWFGHNAIIEKLIERGSRAIYAYDIHCRTPLITALGANRTSTALLLLQLGPRAVNMRDKYDTIPLFDAVSCLDNSKLIEAFMRFGCTDINAINHNGYSSLQCAAIYGCVESARTLIQLGCRTTYESTADSSSPFDIAFASTHLRMASLLYIVEGVQHKAKYLARITEEERYDERHSIYFRRSLANRLLYTNDRLYHLRQNLKNKH